MWRLLMLLAAAGVGATHPLPHRELYISASAPHFMAVPGFFGPVVEVVSLRDPTGISGSRGPRVRPKCGGPGPERPPSGTRLRSRRPRE